MATCTKRGMLEKVEIFAASFPLTLPLIFPVRERYVSVQDRLCTSRLADDYCCTCERRIFVLYGKTFIFLQDSTHVTIHIFLL